jgi:hypothetical protein
MCLPRGIEGKDKMKTLEEKIEEMSKKMRALEEGKIYHSNKLREQEKRTSFTE